VSYFGAFTQDDNQQTFQILVGDPTTITLQSWGFAGGTNAAGSVIPAGGFATVLSLFDPSGLLVTSDTGGTAPDGCTPRNIDEATGFCLDAYVSESVLTSGSWTAVLTEFDNTANGPALADGFTQDGAGNFNNGFQLFYTFQRTGNWAVDINDGYTPEPAAAWLTLAGLGFLARYRRRRKE